ncbi:hypothetical protein FACS1894166_08150 [Bacilli bacterium]|nr:hypothetical protein FACS1894166_08150 [Bacilli bacterium]
MAGLAAAGIATGTYFGVTQSQKNSQGNGKDFNIKVNGSNILSEKDSVVSVVAHNASNVQ